MIHKENQIKYGWIKEVNFFSRSMKSLLEKNDIEICLTRSEGRSVLAKTFVKMLKSRPYKFINKISKNVYI